MCVFLHANPDTVKIILDNDKIVLSVILSLSILELAMSAALLFTIANVTALAGWAILVAGVLFSNAMLRDLIAGRIVPLILAVVYTALIVIHWPSAEGGYGSLDDVARLFGNSWLLLAGWVHYLAFDLTIGAVIARRTADEKLPRFVLVPILPLTFLFGPIGLLGFESVRLIAQRLHHNATA
jgi:hypothetical protein